MLEEKVEMTAEENVGYKTVNVASRIDEKLAGSESKRWRQKANPTKETDWCEMNTFKSQEEHLLQDLGTTNQNHPGEISNNSPILR